MRVKGGTVRHDNRKRILKRAEGYFGSRHRLYKTAKEAVLYNFDEEKKRKVEEAVLKADAYSFVGRKENKRNYRKLWISRISAACKANGTSYSKFMHGLQLAEIKLNRKMLSEIAANDEKQFAELIKKANEAIDNSTKA